MSVNKYLYLMVKTHIVTGLKYLCKRVTTSDSKAISYKGSGKYWKNHLKIHGKNINTEILASVNVLTNGDIGYFLKKDRIVKSVKGWTKI